MSLLAFCPDGTGFVYHELVLNPEQEEVLERIIS